jgi:hypothetical protein
MAVLGPAVETRFRILASQVGTNANSLVRQLHLALLTAIVPATPVDTGRARSNWLTGLNTARREQVGYPVAGAGDAIDPSGTSSLVEGQQVGAAFRAPDVLYLSNNLPYIGALNEGWSRQAPAGYVQQAIETSILSIRGLRLLR